MTTTDGPPGARLAETAAAMRGVADTLDTAAVNRTPIPADVAGLAHGDDMLEATANLLEALAWSPHPPVLFAALAVCDAFWAALAAGGGV